MAPENLIDQFQEWFPSRVRSFQAGYVTAGAHKAVTNHRYADTWQTCQEVKCYTYKGSDYTSDLMVAELCIFRGSAALLCISKCYIGDREKPLDHHKPIARKRQKCLSFVANTGHCVQCITQIQPHVACASLGGEG